MDEPVESEGLRAQLWAWLKTQRWILVPVLLAVALLALLVAWSGQTSAVWIYPLH